FEMTSVRTFASTPNPSAILNASLTATAATPAIRLLQSLATSPDPTGPTWMMFEPIAASTGRASSKSRASPPTMIASVPSVARGTPPDTGASMKRAPRRLTASATRRDTLGSMVDMSMQSRPAPMPSRTPPEPRYADSTWDDEGRIVITSSLSLAAAADDAARAAPSLIAPSRAASTTSYATTPCPFFRTFASMGWPIAPIPMNPIFMEKLLRGSCGVGMGACMAGYQAAYFTAVTLAGIAVVALVAICSAPLMIAALSPWLLGERLAPRVRAALLLGVFGTALLVASPSGTLDPSARFLGGVLLAFVAGLAYALYVLAAKATLRRSAPLPTTALTFTIGALLLTPALWWTTAPLTQLALGWPWLVYLGGVATAGAYAIYTVGLRRVPASVAGVTTLLEPL